MAEIRFYEAKTAFLETATTLTYRDVVHARNKERLHDFLRLDLKDDSVGDAYEVEGLATCGPFRHLRCECDRPVRNLDRVLDASRCSLEAFTFAPRFTDEDVNPNRSLDADALLAGWPAFAGVLLSSRFPALRRCVLGDEELAHAFAKPLRAVPPDPDLAGGRSHVPDFEFWNAFGGLVPLQTFWSWARAPDSVERLLRACPALADFRVPGVLVSVEHMPLDDAVTALSRLCEAVTAVRRRAEASASASTSASAADQPQRGFCLAFCNSAAPHAEAFVRALAPLKETLAFLALYNVGVDLDDDLTSQSDGSSPTCFAEACPRLVYLYTAAWRTRAEGGGRWRLRMKTPRCVLAVFPDDRATTMADAPYDSEDE